MAENSFDPENLDRFKKEMKAILRNAKEVNKSFSNWGSELSSIAEFSKTISERQEKIYELEQKRDNETDQEKKELLKQQVEYEKQKLELQQNTLKNLKKQFSITKTLGNETVSFLSKQTRLLSGMKDMYYDIDESVRKTSMSMGLSSSSLQTLHRTALGVAGTYASLGIDVKEAAQAQQTYADETGRTVLLTENVLNQMGKLSKLTGLNVQELGEMSAQMNNFGLAGEAANNMVGKIRDYAKGAGVNVGNVLKKMKQNIGIMNKLSFKDGVKSFGRLVTYAEKFKMDIASTAESAKQMWSPEGAIEASASLQTLGGGFSKLADPFQMMFDARNNPEKYAQSITNSLKDIGKYKGGEFIISPYEMQRLEEAGKALGYSGEQMAEMARQKAKMDKIGGSLSMFGDKKDRDMLSGMIEFNEKGQPIIGDKTLKQLQANNNEGLNLLLKQEKTNEENAKLALSTREMFMNLSNQVMATFLPILEALDPLLRDTVKWIGDFVEKNPKWTALFVGGGMIFGKSVEWISRGYLMGVGFNSAIKGSGLFSSIIGGFKNMLGFGGKAAAAATTSVAGGVGGAGGQMNAAQTLAQGKASKAAGIGSFMKSLGSATQIIAISGALFIFAKALQEFNTVDFTSVIKGGLALGVLLGGMKLMEGINPTNVMKGALGIAALGASLIPFGYAMGLMKGVDVGMIFGVVGAISALAGVATLLGTVAMTPMFWVGLGAIAASSVVLAGSIWLLGESMNMAAPGFELFLGSLSQLPNLIGPMLLSGPALLGMAAGITALGLSLMSLGVSTVGGGFLGLWTLSSVAESLGTAFKGIDADGITKSVEAINNVNMEKIEALKELSTAMALWGKVETKPIEVNMNVGGKIKVEGDGSTEFKVDKLSETQLRELKNLIFQKRNSDRNGGSK